MILFYLYPKEQENLLLQQILTTRESHWPNVVRFICNQSDAERMKFSTLTNDDLILLMKTKLSHLDWGQAMAEKQDTI
jgi:hypothetical protein